MNIVKTSLLCFVAFFPIFSLKSNLNNIEIILSIFFFLVPILILNYVLIKKKLINNFFSKLYLSILIVLSIDNSLGLWNGVIQPLRPYFIDIFTVIYYPSVLFLFILIIIFYLIITFTEKKFLNIILVFVSTIFLFSVFDQAKSYKKIKDYELETKEIFPKTNIVFIFDEMSGLNSFESRYDNNQIDEKIKNFYKKYNFEFYSNIKSTASNSVSSLSSLLNLTSEFVRKQTVRESKNYFYEYEMHKNLFFEKFKNISVYQNIHIDYCLAKNISKCKTYNPFSQKVFLDGFKNTFFTKIISLWKLNGSIISTLTWRTLREIRIIDSILEPEGHKVSFNNLFNNINNDIVSKNYDLIFVHTLVPHRPYGFNEDCKYNGKLSLRNNLFSEKEHINQHNIERNCVINFLDNFINNLKLKDKLNTLDITILSDHGARISKDDESSNVSVMFAIKNQNTIYKEFSEDAIMQSVFKELFN
tara:strand:- start:630 stop:2048 length:1419 start_codon:yes stop_codon:yes gene_type:complete